MNRRLYLKSIITTASVIFSNLLIKKKSRAENKNNVILLQKSYVAGFQFYDGEKVWSKLKPGQKLQLIRQPENEYDDCAVKILWRNQQLGYLPRAENSVAAQMLDRGEKVSARISRLWDSYNPWERVEVEVFFVVGEMC